MKVIALFFATIAAASAFAPSTTIPFRESAPLFAQEEEAAVTAVSAMEGPRPQIQFVKGLEEKAIPKVKLTRARDGTSGIATFLFDNPNVFDASTASQGEITGLFMSDEEGEISTTDVNASFSNGKPQSIESVYVMTSPEQWDRFMRFMERYGEANGLGLSKA
ncbi:II reaction center PSB28 protein [Seminavis robusta]|uniref:Photosystem II reaction center Psb28 protein n=1 Tax=Seminavis robusta TaxID=568900 RepID=A0A9N8EMN7_9STRA|nr:II reaction center PSB28 protein [Seminavis robusta]|eukprot:Sro1425_g271500.1 II reaction center PSB28 protein (163) ;mRNA; f:2405-2893